MEVVRNTPEPRRPRRRRLGYIVAGVVLLVLAISWPATAHLYTDLRWFRSLGFEDVFTTVLSTELLVGTVVGLIVALAVGVNLWLAVRLTRRFPSFQLADPTGQTRIEIGALAPKLPIPVAVLIGIIAGLGAADHWVTWLQWKHAAEFGARDPILGYDAGFYVFELPALDAVCSLGLWIVGLSLVLSAAMHFLGGGLRMTPKGPRAHRPTRVHLSVLGSLAFLLLAFEAWLDIPELMYSTTGPVAGASYADVHAQLPALRIEIAAAVAAAVLVGVSATRKRLVLLLAGIAVYALVDLIGVRLYPALIQRFTVAPNEAMKEAPFIEHNIAATRAGFDLAHVEERELSGEVTLTRQDIENNRATIENVRLWDHQPLLDTFAQIQEIRTYYEFGSVDNDRYVIDGQLRQTMLSPRELAAESLPNRTWINEHFTFTHGYGLTLGPVNMATEQGLPVLFVQDIPPESEMAGVQVTRPEIYFGEMTNDYVFVRTAAREFDHPSGEENVYAEYEGSAGVHLDGTFTRTAMATRLGSLKLLLSEDLDEDSRVLLYRDIRQRVRRLAPFLRYDEDPYMVVRDDGSLVWIQDAYTVSGRYPYSQPFGGGVNYIRNSVKVTIDAYDGEVTFYVADAEDPVLKTWRRIFPSLFTDMEEMPADVRAHLRYPEDIFAVQTDVFTTYHMESAELVYNREDQWEIPAVRQHGDTQRMVPYYTVMRLPGEDDAEFIQMIPFTPKRKDNLAAWMVARMDGEHLGEMMVYRFPKDRLVFGPAQVMNRINQDADISRQISLWDQRGSEAIMGTLLVIPVEESLLYVTPLYLRSEGGRIPELKRVIVAYENRIAMEPTLDAALEALFDRLEAAEARADAEEGAEEAAAEATEAAGTAEGEAETTEAPGEPPAAAAATTEEPAEPAGDASMAELAAEARERYEAAVEAQRRGDWAGYGEELERLERVLERMAP